MIDHRELASTGSPDDVSGDRIRIMLVIGGLGLGGAEMVVRDLARYLDSRRYKVSICCTKGLGFEIDQELLSDGFDVFGIPKDEKKRVEYLAAHKLWRAIRERRIDIVHTHATSALFDAAPCRVFLRRTKLVHTFHYGNYPLESRRYHILEKICSRAADRLIAVGNEQRDRIRATYKLPPSRIDTVWNGVAVSRQSNQTSIREQIGTGNRLLIGTIAKLIPQKGLDTLLNVARECKQLELPYQFVLVGDGPLRADLERRKQELGLDDTFVFSGWVSACFFHKASTSLCACDTTDSKSEQN